MRATLGDFTCLALSHLQSRKKVPRNSKCTHVAVMAPSR